MGTKPGCCLGPLGPASGQRPPTETEVKEGSEPGDHWEMQGVRSLVPTVGEPEAEKQGRTGQGHVTVSSKARSPIPPEASCPGFGTLKTHLFPTLDCTPGCVEPIVSATLAEALAESTLVHFCQQGAQLPGFSRQGMEFPT